jgi:hypothetical protein
MGTTGSGKGVATTMMLWQCDGGRRSYRRWKDFQNEHDAVSICRRETVTYKPSCFVSAVNKNNQISCVGLYWKQVPSLVVQKLLIPLSAHIDS